MNELRAFTGIEATSSQIQLPAGSGPTHEILKEALELSHLAMGMVNTLFVTLGKLGVMVTSKGNVDEPLLTCCNTECATTRLYPPPVVSAFISVSGAGDCFAAGVLAGMLRGLSEPQCVAAGTAAAAMSIAAHSTVPQKMAADCIKWGSTVKYQLYPGSI